MANLALHLILHEFTEKNLLRLEIARVGQLIPGDTNINNFGRHVDLNNQGQVAFLAVLKGDLANGFNIALLRGGGLGLILIAKKGQSIPGQSAAIDFFFDPKFSLNKQGQVVFTAILDSGQESLVVHDDAIGLIEIASTGDSFLGSTISELDFSGTSDHDVAAAERRGLNDRGTVAFWFKLADGRQGIAVWNMPRAGVTDLRINGSDVQLSVASLAHRTAVIQTSTDLTEGFTDLGGGTVVGGSGPVITNITHLGGATNASARFYRLRFIR